MNQAAKTEGLVRPEGFSGEPLCLSTETAAAYLGVPIGTIRRWAAEGLPFVRAGAGGKKVFDRRDLARWIERLKESHEN